MNQQTTTITIEFKQRHEPNSEEHLQHLALEWCRSKGAEIINGKIRIWVNLKPPNA